MIINHNMNALNAHRMMSGNTVASGKSMEKLSSGLRINRAGDDAAGLAISEKMRGQIRGLDQAQRNSQDGISMIQTAEGALNETHSILQRMRELATQAANDTNTSKDRDQIQNEVNQLTSEINRIGNTTEFNTQKVLDGGAAAKAAGVGAGDKAVAGSFEFTLGTVVNGDTIKIDEQTFTVAGTTDAATGKFADATGLKAAIEANATLKDKYDVTEASGKFTLTQKAGKESATGAKIEATIANGTDKTTFDASIKTVTEGKAVATADGATEAVAASKSFDKLKLTAVTPGVDGNDISVEIKEDATATTAASVAYDEATKKLTITAGSDNLKTENLVEAINKDATASKIVKAEGTGTDAVKVATGKLEGGVAAKAAEGEAFSATLQIGANEGQAFKITIKDMRSEALGISQKVASTGDSAKTGEAAKASYAVTGADLGTIDGTHKVTIATGTNDNIKFVAGGKTAEITLSGVDYDGNANKTADDLVKDINAKIAGTPDLKDKITAEIKDGKLTFTSTEKDFEIQAGTNNALTALKVTAGKGTEVKPEATEATEATGTAFAKTANVTNGTTEEVQEAALDMSSHKSATAAIKVLDEAINKVSTERSTLGAYQNRLEHTINNLGTSSENLTAAESRIRDVDMAKEMMTFSKNNILAQAAQAMLAQANQQPQGVLQLLR